MTLYKAMVVHLELLFISSTTYPRFSSDQSSPETHYKPISITHKCNSSQQQPLLQSPLQPPSKCPSSARTPSSATFPTMPPRRTQTKLLRRSATRPAATRQTSATQVSSSDAPSTTSAILLLLLTRAATDTSEQSKENSKQKLEELGGEDAFFSKDK